MTAFFCIGNIVKGKAHLLGLIVVFCLVCAAVLVTASETTESDDTPLFGLRATGAVQEQGADAEVEYIQREDTPSSIFEGDIKASPLPTPRASWPSETCDSTCDSTCPSTCGNQNTCGDGHTCDYSCDTECSLTQCQQTQHGTTCPATGCPSETCSTCYTIGCTSGCESSL